MVVTSATPTLSSSSSSSNSSSSNGQTTSPRRPRLNGSGSGRSLLATTGVTNAEDAALDLITKENEARLARVRKERMEAREMRLRELDKQVKEMEDTSDRHYDLLATSGGTPSGDYSSLHRGSVSYPLRTTFEARTSSMSSRRSSQESLDTLGTNADTRRDLRYQDLDERYRKAMITNAQLDNEKQSFIYQIDLFRDEMDIMEENNIRFGRDFKDKARAYDQMKREFDKMTAEFEQYKAALNERDRLLVEAGLVLIRNDQRQLSLMSLKTYQEMCAKEDRAEVAALKKKWAKGLAGRVSIHNGNGHLEDEKEIEEEEEEEVRLLPLEISNSLSLISAQASELLSEVEGETLEGKLRNLLQAKKSLETTTKELCEELEEERRRYSSLSDSVANSSLHLSSELQGEIQREVNKLTNEYRIKLKKAETEITTLSGNVSRLESQLARYKMAAEESEKLEDELKADKRKTQRELREALTRVEELESANAHLQKRIDKLKTNRNLYGIAPSTPTSICSGPPSYPVGQAFSESGSSSSCSSTITESYSQTTTTSGSVQNGSVD